MNQAAPFPEAVAGSPSRRRTIVILLVFITAYAICGLIYQLRSSAGPASEAAAMEFFTRGLLWMLSLTCLLIAASHGSWKLVFWLSGCAALAFLALDEGFEYHEQTERRGWFDDDYIKIASWLGAAAVLFLIYHMERPCRIAVVAMLLGYTLHSLYVLVETGDGEFFQLPFPKRTLAWAEEIFELLFLSSYLAAFLLIHVGTGRVPPMGPGVPRTPMDPGQPQ